MCVRPLLFLFLLSLLFWPLSLSLFVILLFLNVSCAVFARCSLNKSSYISFRYWYDMPCFLYSRLLARNLCFIQSSITHAYASAPASRHTSIRFDDDQAVWTHLHRCCSAFLCSAFPYSNRCLRKAGRENACSAVHLPWLTVTCLFACQLLSVLSSFSSVLFWLVRKCEATAVTAAGLVVDGCLCACLRWGKRKRRETSVGKPRETAIKESGEKKQNTTKKYRLTSFFLFSSSSSPSSSPSATSLVRWNELHGPISE